MKKELNVYVFEYRFPIHTGVVERSPLTVIVLVAAVITGSNLPGARVAAGDV
jgi:hypothetical protein